MPITFWTMLIGALSLSGIPPFSGFFSKDEIIRVTTFNWVVCVALIITVAITTFYTFRMIGMVFFGKKSQYLLKLEEEGKKLHEAEPVMTIPLIILAALSIFVWLLYPDIVSFLITRFHGMHGHSISFESFLRHAFVSPLFAISIIMIIIGLYPAYKIYITRTIRPEDVTISKLHSLLRNRWYWNPLYYWLAERTRRFAERIRWIQTGISNINVAYMVAGAIVFLMILILI